MDHTQLRKLEKYGDDVAYKKVDYLPDVFIQTTCTDGSASTDNNTFYLKKDTITNEIADNTKTYNNTFNITLNLNGQNVNEINKEEIKSFFQQLKDIMK